MGHAYPNLKLCVARYCSVKFLAVGTILRRNSTMGREYAISLELILAATVCLVSLAQTAPTGSVVLVERRGCRGSCPDYEVEIHEDGEVNGRKINRFQLRGKHRRESRWAPRIGQGKFH